MFYEDKKVKIPSGCKLSKRQNFTYVQLVIGHTYVPVKRYYLDKKVCIGRVINDDTDYMNPNDKYFVYFKDSNIETTEKIKNSQILFQ